MTQAKRITAPIPAVPASAYDRAMWMSWGLFWASLLALAVVILTGWGGLRALFAAIVLTGGSWAGAFLAQQMALSAVGAADNGPPPDPNEGLLIQYPGPSQR